MRFLRRRDEPNAEIPYEPFWVWWGGARDRIARAIAERTLPAVVDEISRNVNALDGRLGWELSKGTKAEHALIVTPEGNPEVRPLALRWADSAPPSDATWEYHSCRQAGPLGTLGIDGRDVNLADFRAIAGWDANRERLDVRLWHPALGVTPPQGRRQIAYLFLDNLLGEDAVERWIGEIEILDLETGGRTPDELKAEVERQAAGATGQAWVLTQGTDHRGNPVLLTVNRALKPIDRPFNQTLVVVTVDRGIEQLANSPESAELEAAEDRLTEALETVGGVYVGRVTEHRRRRIFAMCPDAARAKDVAEGWARAERRFGPSIEVRPDPGWKFREELGL
jgi:hypothetical protein